MLIKSKGQSYPYGATQQKHGINFAVYAQGVAEMSLCLYHEGSKNPFESIALDPETNRSGVVWHICLQGLPDSFVYGYRVLKNTTQEAKAPSYMLLDPYAKCIASDAVWREKARKKFAYRPLGK